MNAAVQSLLDAFEDLSASEQYEVARTLLRRATQAPSEELSDDALNAAADKVFLELDEREAADARPAPR